MADESQNTRVFMEKEEAIQVICAALQGGALKLPFATEFHDHIKKAPDGLKFETFARAIQYPVDGCNGYMISGRMMDQFMVPAYSDGLYLLTHRRNQRKGFLRSGCSGGHSLNRA